MSHRTAAGIARSVFSRSSSLHSAGRARASARGGSPCRVDALEQRVLFADIGFAAAPSIAIGAFPTGVVADDFNGDGLADLAVAHQGVAAFGLMLGRGDGTFAPEVRFTTVGTTWAITSGDFNGDGKRDVAATRSSGNGVTVWYGRGDGTFFTSVQITVGTQPHYITAGRINADNRDDLVVVGVGTNNVRVLLSTGGSFSTTLPITPHGATAATVADFTGDGRADLALAMQLDNAVDVRPGNGNGTFGLATRYAAGTSPRDVI